jgi:guanosine-3',5'-bis(diphosphate) 3'-pyrophosphohydrolase
MMEIHTNSSALPFGSIIQKKVQQQYDALLHTFSTRFLPKEVEEVHRAFLLAIREHGDRKRKSGEPYILHLLRVATIVVQEMELDQVSIQAVFLHDLIENGTYSVNDLRRDFGGKVAKIAHGVTKIKGVVGRSGAAQQDTFKRLVTEFAEDPGIILVKIADRLEDMRTLKYISKCKQLRIAAETQAIYAPTAQRMRLHTIKAELADLSMKYLNPDVYFGIARKLSFTKKKREANLTAFSLPIENKLLNEGFSYKLYKRSKSISSIHHKMESRGLPFEEIYDLDALRIILNCSIKQEKMQCWHVYAIISNL